MMKICVCHEAEKPWAHKVGLLYFMEDILECDGDGKKISGLLDRIYGKAQAGGVKK